LKKKTQVKEFILEIDLIRREKRDSMVKLIASFGRY